MKIIFVRHGETVFNREKRYQGHLDAQLSSLGKRQVSIVAERLKNDNLSAIYSSDLSRAHDTALAIAAYHDLEVIVDQDLREVHLGAWQGLSINEIPEHFPEDYTLYKTDSVKHRPTNGERLEDLQQRVVRAVERIADAHLDDTVVIVTHGGPIRAFFCYALNAPLTTFRKLRLDNTGLTIFHREPDGRWILDTLNDVCHGKHETVDRRQ